MLRKLSDILTCNSCLDRRNAADEERAMGTMQQGVTSNVNRSKDGQDSFSDVRRWRPDHPPRDITTNQTSDQVRSSYSSSTLQEPVTTWSAYYPKDGVAWAPHATHTVKEESGDVLSLGERIRTTLPRRVVGRPSVGAGEPPVPEAINHNVLDYSNAGPVVFCDVIGGIRAEDRGVDDDSQNRKLDDPSLMRGVRQNHTFTVQRSKSTMTIVEKPKIWKASRRRSVTTGNVGMVPLTRRSNSLQLQGTSDKVMGTALSQWSLVGVADITGHGGNGVPEVAMDWSNTHTDYPDGGQRCQDSTVCGRTSPKVAGTSRASRSSLAPSHVARIAEHVNATKGVHPSLGYTGDKDISPSFHSSNGSLVSVSIGEDASADAASRQIIKPQLSTASIENILNQSSSNLYLTCSKSKMLTSIESLAEYFEDSYIDYNALYPDSLCSQTLEDFKMFDLEFAKRRLRSCLEWPLDMEDANLSGDISSGNINITWQDGLTRDDWTSPPGAADEEDLKAFLDLHDLGSVLLDRDRVRTGRLVMTDETRAHRFCSGSLRLPLNNGPSSSPCKPVTIQIHRGLNREEDRINLLRSAMVTRGLRHPHVHQMHGLCLEGSPFTRDGVEVMAVLGRTHFLVTLHGLMRWTAENNPKLMTPRCVLTFALQMCSGLTYLDRVKVIHTNLTSSAIRLDNNCHVVIGDLEPFPLSTTRPPVRWLPLEAIVKGVFSKQSPIWSFGVILWEILSGGIEPYPHLDSDRQVALYLTKGKRLIRPPGCPTALYDLMLHCWQSRPRDRPPLNQIVHRLQLYLDRLPMTQTPTEVFPDREDFWTILHEHV